VKGHPVQLGVHSGCRHHTTEALKVYFLDLDIGRIEVGVWRLFRFSAFVDDWFNCLVCLEGQARQIGRLYSYWKNTEVREFCICRTTHKIRV
jgi:hypothetical protein